MVNVARGEHPGAICFQVVGFAIELPFFGECVVLPLWSTKKGRPVRYASMDRQRITPETDSCTSIVLIQKMTKSETS
jgi:hypothetical protein